MFFLLTGITVGSVLLILGVVLFGSYFQRKRREIELKEVCVYIRDLRPSKAVLNMLNKEMAFSVEETCV